MQFTKCKTSHENEISAATSAAVIAIMLCVYCKLKCRHNGNHCPCSSAAQQKLWHSKLSGFNSSLFMFMQHTHTHAVLNDNFPVEPGLVSCPLTFIFQLFLSDASSWDSPNLFISTHCNTIPPCFSWTSATHDGDKCTLYCKVNSHHYSPQEPLKGFITFGHIGIHTGLNQCGLRNGWLSCPPKGKVT